MSAKKRTKLALFLGASALNFSNMPLNVATVASNTFRGIFFSSSVFTGIVIVDGAASSRAEGF